MTVLRIITSYADLDGPRLMEVYAESNFENTDYFFPELEDKALAVRKVEEGFLTFLRDEFFAGPGPAYYVLEEAGTWVSALRLNEVEPGIFLPGGVRDSARVSAAGLCRPAAPGGHRPPEGPRPFPPLRLRGQGKWALRPDPPCLRLSNRFRGRPRLPAEHRRPL